MTASVSLLDNSSSRGGGVWPSLTIRNRFGLVTLERESSTVANSADFNGCNPVLLGETSWISDLDLRCPFLPLPRSDFFSSRNGDGFVCGMSFKLGMNAER